MFASLPRPGLAATAPTDSTAHCRARCRTSSLYQVASRRVYSEHKATEHNRFEGPEGRPCVHTELRHRHVVYAIRLLQSVSTFSYARSLSSSRSRTPVRPAPSARPLARLRPLPLTLSDSLLSTFVLSNKVQDCVTKTNNTHVYTHRAECAFYICTSWNRASTSVVCTFHNTR